MDRPELIDDPDLDDLKDALENFMDGQCHDDDPHKDCECAMLIFEKVMETFYGEDIHDYLNDEFFD